MADSEPKNSESLWRLCDLASNQAPLTDHDTKDLDPHVSSRIGEIDIFQGSRVGRYRHPGGHIHWSDMTGM
jgi:hypothetical protein